MCPPIFRSARSHLVLATCFLCCLNPATNAQEDDFFPGLLATYRSRGHEVQRIDSALNFDWGDSAPDERLPSGAFEAAWSSWLLVRSPGMHQFHVLTAGDVTIEVDGVTVLEAQQSWGFVTSPPVSLTPGDHELVVTYRSPSESDQQRARLAVFWSSDSFTLEPIPADVLFRDEPADAQITDSGRMISDAFRCAACHRDQSGLAALSAPSLDRIEGSQTRDTLVQRLLKPADVVSNTHMPDFGFTRQEAEDVAAFLASVSAQQHVDKAFKFKEDDVRAGNRLLLSLGCVACHTVSASPVGVMPISSPYDAPELINTGIRRSPLWLGRWLKSPASLNADHRMPKFELSEDERRQLVAALSGKTNQTAPDPVRSPTGDIKNGRRLVDQSNCASCHSIPGVDARVLPPLLGESIDSSADQCLNPAGDSRVLPENGYRRPEFSMLRDERAESILKWISTRQHDGHAPSSDQGRLLLARNGCTACHDRNASRGLSSIASQLQRSHPGLDGQSQGLIPPSLTAVGDKLTSDYLKTAIAGRQKERRLPWLLVRMPEFRHTAEESSAILAHLQATDLIPVEADAARQDILSHVAVENPRPATAEELLLGNQLTGAGGFNCVACHQAGPFQPRNVALGTRGSDLMTMGARIRTRYFQRWMKNPIRVVAGIEMPAIRKAMPDVHDGSLPRQIGTIWTALRDPKFTPPTVTSRFEQLISVGPDESPRVIRDVFTIGTQPNQFEAVARALAIGFSNSHNLLIDLDTMQLRLWTVGEFARQRTEGKSWYWDMPGTLIRKSGITGAIHNLRTSDGQVLKPVEDEGRLAELLSYRMIDDRIHIRSRSWYRESGEVSSPPREPHAAETAWNSSSDPLEPVTFEHKFSAINPRGYRRELRILDGPPSWRLNVDWRVDQDSPSQIAVEFADVVPSDGEPGRAIQVDYLAKLDVPGHPASKPIPPIMNSPAKITSVPGFEGQRLPLDSSTMPTSIAWTSDGRLAFTSLKGHVFVASDTDGDSLPDTASVFEEGLAAPFGIVADGDSLVVAHKPEILRLTDTDGDGRADERYVLGSGWGYSDNYHDWASGLIKDEDGNFYVGLGSDYSQKKRPARFDRWRGGVVRIDPSGYVTPLGLSMRYPMGLAMDRAGNLFATDNQGVQNTFNEINHILPGRHYGVPSRHQPTESLKTESPAVMIPHPWSRSVNSLLFLDESFPIPQMRGHGIACEYDSRFLMRFTLQDVGGVLQGASYKFSRHGQEAGGSNFIGPICSALGPKGDIYVGSIWDSGWQGGLNTGGIARLRAQPEKLQNGIREVRATKSGFEVSFFHPVDPAGFQDPADWVLQGYTRVWGGNYSTPDSGRYRPEVREVHFDEHRDTVELQVSGLKAGYLYDISFAGRVSKTPLWPAEAHYSMKVLP